MVLALLAMAATAAGILAATATASGVKREHADITLKMGYVTGRAHPYGLAMAQYERRVEAASGGRVDIQLTPVYAGGDDVALLNDIAGGTQDGGAVSIAVLPGANINNLIPLQLPFLVDSYELEQRLIVNSSGIAQQMLRGIERNAKLVPVGLFEGGMRHFVLKNKYVDSLSALKGVKIRAVPSSHLVDTFRALGAQPQALAVGDVAAAIRSGLVEGAEANSGLVATFGWHTAGANRISVVNIFPFPAVVMFNKDRFNALPADIQKILRDEANDLAAYSISVVKDTTTFPARLCSQGVRYAGVPDKVRNQMVAATKKVITKYTTKKYRNLAPIVAAILRQKARIKGTPTDAPPSSCIDGPATKFLKKP
jgi:TRAP-type C4-dicarboxylate transport system substrate-binding protein